METNPGGDNSEEIVDADSYSNSELAEIRMLLYGKNAVKKSQVEDDNENEDEDEDDSNDEETEVEEDEDEEDNDEDDTDEYYTGLKIERNCWTLRDIIFEISDGGCVLALASEGFADE
jgi:ABC-type Zn2+ transport system substrate-binding protein/surface adhesin